MRDVEESPGEAETKMMTGESDTPT